MDEGVFWAENLAVQWLYRNKKVLKHTTLKYNQSNFCSLLDIAFLVLIFFISFFDCSMSPWKNLGGNNIGVITLPTFAVIVAIKALI